MPIASLGVKRRCLTCAAPFYDLNHSPIVCPKCSATFTIVELPRQASPRPVRRWKQNQPEVAKAAAEPLPDGEEHEVADEIEEDGEESLVSQTDEDGDEDELTSLTPIEAQADDEDAASEPVADADPKRAARRR
jgi:uncharacterized protein (TIGR02300 family)